MRTCTVCNEKYGARGYCKKHYKMFMKYGDPLCRVRGFRGEGSMCMGYKVFRRNGKLVMFHREVLEKKLGRKLKPWPLEIAHHINGDKLDNRPENLEVMSNAAHTSRHSIKSPVKGSKKWCTSCLKWLSKNLFWKNRFGFMGLNSRCGKCTNTRSKKYSHSCVSCSKLFWSRISRFSKPTCSSLCREASDHFCQNMVRKYRWKS